MCWQSRAHTKTRWRHGLPRTHVTELANGLTQFREATAQAQVLRQRHQDTRSKLERAVVSLSEPLQLMDAYSRVRFQRDEGLLARWSAVRTLGKPAATRTMRSSGEGVVAPVGNPSAGNPAGAPAGALAPSEPAPGAGTEPPRDDRPSAAA
jgi:hypothetical protein